MNDFQTIFDDSFRLQRQTRFKNGIKTFLFCMNSFGTFVHCIWFLSKLYNTLFIAFFASVVWARCRARSFSHSFANWFVNVICSHGFYVNRKQPNLSMFSHSNRQWHRKIYSLQNIPDRLIWICLFAECLVRVIVRNTSFTLFVCCTNTIFVYSYAWLCLRYRQSYIRMTFIA